MRVLDKGSLDVVASMGDDSMVANCARVSFANDDWMVRLANARDEKLIVYLAAHRHVSPFYHPAISFRFRLPISIHRQLERHRVGTAMNSESTRYSEIREEFYVPEVMRGQSRTNKQGSEGACDDQEKLRSRFTASCRNSFIEYARLLRYGVAREQARDLLPLATYTSCIWTASLMAVAHFINLRDDDHAQPEIRAYAQAMRTLAEPIFPISLRELCKGTSA